MNTNRDMIKGGNKDMPISEFGKKAGEMWKDMKDKSEWEAKAAEDKIRYDREYKQWMETGGKELIAQVQHFAT